MDTGAEVSLWPAGPRSAVSDPSIRLVAANGQPIPSFGRETRTIKLPTGTYQHEFVLAQVQRPLIGADFLHKFRLMVDMDAYRLIDKASLRSANMRVCAPSQALGVSGVKNSPTCAGSVKNKYQALLSEFTGLTSPDFCSPVVDHGVVHHLPTTGAPLHSKARKLSPDKLKVAREVFDNNMHHLFTWFQRQTSQGGPVETTGASTMRQYPTGTRCLTNKTQRQQDKTSPVNFLVFSDKLFTTPNPPFMCPKL